MSNKDVGKCTVYDKTKTSNNGATNARFHVVLATTPRGNLGKNGEKLAGQMEARQPRGGRRNRRVLSRRRKGYLFGNTTEHLCMMRMENNPLDFFQQEARW